MPVFDYRAVTPQGEFKTGQMTAQSEREVVARLQSMGLIPMSSAPHSPPDRQVRRSFFTSHRKTLKHTDIAELTRQLAILLGAGLALDRSLDVAGRVSSFTPLVELIAEIQNAVRAGEPLSGALAAFPELFPAFYINFVHAAELSGDLAKNLADLSTYLEKSLALREQVKSALIYPAILIGVTLVSLGIIVIVVLPEFSRLFADMDAALPASTAFVLGAADLLRNYGYILLSALAGGVFYWRQKRTDPQWLYKRDERLLKVALLNDLIKKINMARFSRSLGTLLRGGVSLLPALSVARESMGNRVLVARLEAVMQSLRDGSGLAGPLASSGVFPEFAVQMIQVGEETGQLDEMLLRVADIYDQEVSTTTQRVLSVLEPVMIIGLGIVIGGIIMSILVAILGINDLPM